MRKFLTVSIILIAMFFIYISCDTTHVSSPTEELKGKINTFYMVERDNGNYDLTMRDHKGVVTVMQPDLAMSEEHASKVLKFDMGKAMSTDITPEQKRNPLFMEVKVHLSVFLYQQEDGRSLCVSYSHVGFNDPLSASPFLMTLIRFQNFRIDYNVDSFYWQWFDPSYPLMGWGEYYSANRTTSTRTGVNMMMYMYIHNFDTPITTPLQGEFPGSAHFYVYAYHPSDGWSIMQFMDTPLTRPEKTFFDLHVRDQPTLKISPYTYRFHIRKAAFWCLPVDDDAHTRTDPSGLEGSGESHLQLTEK